MPLGEGDGDEDEEELDDEDVTEEAGGEEEEEGVGKEVAGGDEEFIDKENEAQFCLETNVTAEGDQEEEQSTAEPDHSTGKS